MSKIHLVVPDCHAHPDFNNDRAELLAKLTIDLRPDVVINLGDTFDMPSLCSYDRGTKAFHGRNYEKDISSGIEFNERWWAPVKRTKKKLPYRVYIEGNHEHRIKRAIQLQPELEGERFGVSFKDLDLSSYYDSVVEYSGGTPGIAEIDGIIYSHFLISGVKGLPISGEHPAYQLLTKHYQSTTVGHLHTVDYCSRTTVKGQRLNGLVAGCFIDYRSDWAGEANKFWWSGVVIKHNVDGFGNYDVEFVSMDQLRKDYGI